MDPSIVELLSQFSRDHVAHEILPTILHALPFVADLAKQNADLIKEVFDRDADAVCAELLDTLREGKANEQALQKESSCRLTLRQVRNKFALLCAIAECGGEWSTQRATGALSDLADASVQFALSYLWANASADYFEGETAPNPDQSGLAIFALGKHGGQELNYSSDIDIVAFYDVAHCGLKDASEAGKFYSRIVRKLADLLQDRDENGYVFRTDLRLRPDPGATPVAMSTDAALIYYEARGQNWERAAWSKARLCAGDRRVADQFLAELSPYIWRKHLDFAAIADIQAMKRQINLSKNVGGLRLAGHNVKLGRGGIREIEFFAQTQALIAGGRDDRLRVIPTQKVLQALSASGWIDQQTERDLIDAYWFLRAVENRVQMQKDEQNHILPTPENELSNIAATLNFETLEAFESAYIAQISIVAKNYDALFADQKDLSSELGNLVFTGADDDPATMETLGQMGFQNPSHTADLVRTWHYGRYASTRSPIARAHLTELLPLLLSQISHSAQTQVPGAADEVLIKFDQFLQKLPAGVELFSMLRAHDSLVNLLITLLSAAPKMSDAIVQRAHVLDGLVDKNRALALSEKDELRDQIDGFLAYAHSFEDLIDRARMVGQEQRFLISAGLISGSISADIAARQFAVLAETLVTKLFAEVRAGFENAHGQFDGAQVGVLAFGRLGSESMSATSDLDVVLIYDVENAQSESDGKRPLSVPVYFARLTQRLVAALSAPTATGVLYEVDMRLRPSGNQGPIATSFSAFENYQSNQAWTWEHMALTRARPVATPPELVTQLDGVIASVLSASRDENKLMADILDMRQRLLKERPAKHHFDLKLAHGGLLDIEFVAQATVLKFAPDHADLLACRTDISAVLNWLEQELKNEDVQLLREAYAFMSAVVQHTSASLIDPLDLANWTDSFKLQLAQNMNMPDFERLEIELKSMTVRVREIVESIFSKFTAD